MVNSNARILNVAAGALSAQQAVIASIGNNIANVNTPGYSRRTAELQTSVGRGTNVGIDVGSGVRLANITRQSDSFVEGLLRGAISDKSSAEVVNDYMKRAEAFFNLDGSQQTLGSTMTAFFDSIHNLTANPSSIELRQNVIERGNDLVNSIKTSYNGIASLQDESDARIVSELETVNSLTSQIADLNGLVVQREGAGGVAADERDQRETLLQKLSEKIGFSRIDNSDGSVTISLSNGFPLVAGTVSRDLAATKSPSFVTGTSPPSLSGSVLNFIVFDYDTGSGTSHIDLTSSMQGMGGTIGGLLSVRGRASSTDTSAFQADGSFVAMATRIEAVTRQLLTTVNTTYLGPDNNASTVNHEPSSLDLNGNTPTPFGLFDFAYSGSKESQASGVAGYGLPDTTDLTATGLDNFSSILSFKVTDPTNFAAARVPVGTTPNSTNLPYGDGSNAEAIGALQSTSMSFSVNSYSLSATFDDQYNDTVSYVGNLSSSSLVTRNVASDSYKTASARRDEVSAVSLDEEFTNLIRFQKAFEASARMIKTAEILLDNIVSLL